MKTIINYSLKSLIVAMLTFIQSLGQSSVTIIAGPPANTFYLVEPETNQDYFEMHNLPSGSKNPTWKWSAVEGEILGSTTLNGCVIKWNSSYLQKHKSNNDRFR